MVLGIDIGATKTWTARLENERLITSRKIPTRNSSSSFLRDLRDLIDGFLSNSGNRLDAIGIGAPGPLDLDNGIFKRLPNLPDWDGFNIRGALASYYGVPVAVQNDANAAALGEAVHGGGRGCDSVYYITISTGIGGGYIVNRKIVTGYNHLTGEIWALPVDNFGEQDILINSASGPGIVRTAKKLLMSGRASSLADSETFDSEDVFKHAQQGDDLAREVMKSAVRNMAYAIITILLAIDPEVILIGGGLACDDDCMINPIRSMLAEQAYFSEHRNANIRKALLWEKAVLYGAVSLFDTPAN
jgi:glucokinase